MMEPKELFYLNIFIINIIINAFAFGIGSKFICTTFGLSILNIVVAIIDNPLLIYITYNYLVFGYASCFNSFIKIKLNKFLVTIDLIYYISVIVIAIKLLGNYHIFNPLYVITIVIIIIKIISLIVICY